MNYEEFRMKEYENLTQEILGHQKRRDQLFLFTIAALGVVFGLSLNEKGIGFVIISYIPYLLIYIFCRSIAINSGHIICIGTYIRHFIESRYKKEIHWQTVWDDIAKDKLKKSKGYWYNFFLTASIATCSGMILLTIINKEKLEIISCPRIISIIIFSGLHMIFCTLCIMKSVWEIYWSKINYEKREYWNNYWIEVKKRIPEKDE